MELGRIRVEERAHTSVQPIIIPTPLVKTAEPLGCMADMSAAAFAKLEKVERMTTEFVQVMLLLGSVDVVAVYKVWNEELDMQYAIAVSGAKQMCSQKMLHGTATASVDSIVREGFKVGGVDVPVRHGSALGKGIYLTSTASVAINYSSMLGSKYIVLSETCVTPDCPRTPNLSYERGKKAVMSAPEFCTVVQPDKALVRPLYVVEFRGGGFGGDVPAPPVIKLSV